VSAAELAAAGVLDFDLHARGSVAPPGDPHTHGEPVHDRAGEPFTPPARFFNCAAFSVFLNDSINAGNGAAS